MRIVSTTSWVALGVMGLSLVLASKAQAQVQALPPTEPNPPGMLQHDGLTASIAVPTEVVLHKSRSFPVIIRVRSLNRQRLPDKVTLRIYGLGTIQSGDQSGEGALDISLRSGVGVALVLFPKLTHPGKEPLPIEVTVAGNPHGFIGSVQVLFRDQDTIEVTEAPKTLPADGATAGNVSAIVKDQLGEPLEGVPCFVNYTLPDGRKRSPVVWSDAQGMLTFALPPSAKAGMAEFQIEAEHTSADQRLLRYEETPQAAK